MCSVMRMFLALSLMFTLSGFGITSVWGNVSTTQPPEDWELFLKDENLTAHINGIPLKLVLERFQKTTNIATVIKGNMEDRLVKADFENLPLEKGLQKLLKGHQFILTFGNSASPKGPSKHKIEALHVYPPPPAPVLASQNPPVTTLAEATPPSKRAKLERKINPVISHEDQVEQPQSHEPDLANMTTKNSRNSLLNQKILTFSWKPSMNYWTEGGWPTLYLSFRALSKTLILSFGSQR